MRVHVCKCCGHPLVADEIGIVLSPMQRRIFNIVKRAGTAGISGKDIMAEIYKNARDGMPPSTNIISVSVSNANPRLAQFNLKIQGKRGPGGLFKIERLFLPTKQQVAA